VAPVTIHHRVDFAASMIDGRTVGEVVPGSASAREISDLWVYLQDKLSRIVRDPALLPAFRPDHLAINSLLEPQDEALPPVVAPVAAYDGPERRSGAERRILLSGASYRGPERRSFGRRQTDAAWAK
jgi:hypothetical protein